MGRRKAGWKNLFGHCGGGGEDDLSDPAESPPAAPGSLPENHLTTINGLFEATPAERPALKDDAHPDNPELAATTTPELRKLNDSQLLQALEMNFRELVGGKPGAGINRAYDGSASAEQGVGDDLPVEEIEIRCYTDRMASSREENPTDASGQSTADKDAKPKNIVDAPLAANDAVLAMPRELSDSSESMKDGKSPSGGAVGVDAVAGATVAPDRATTLSNSASEASSIRGEQAQAQQPDQPDSSLETPAMTAQVSPWSSASEPVSVLDHWLEQQQMQQLGSDNGKEFSEEAVAEGVGAEPGLPQAEEEEQELAQPPSALQGWEQQAGTGGFTRLEDRVVMLEARCDEIEEENAFLKDKLEEYEKQCQAMMDRVVRSNRQQELLKEKLQVYMQRNALLDDAAKSLLERAQKAETCNADLKTKAEVLEHFINERQSAEARARGTEGTGGQAPEDGSGQEPSTSRELCEIPPSPEATPLLEASADASGSSDISFVLPAERTSMERGATAAAGGGMQPRRDISFEGHETNADTQTPVQEGAREKDGREEEDGASREAEGSTGGGGGDKKLGRLLEGMSPPVCSSHSSSSSSSAGSTAGRGRQHEERHDQHRHRRDIPPPALQPSEQQHQNHHHDQHRHRRDLQTPALQPAEHQHQNHHHDQHRHHHDLPRPALHPEQQQQAAPRRDGHQQPWTIASADFADSIQQQMLELYGYDFRGSAPAEPQAAPPGHHHVVPCISSLSLMPTVPSGPPPGNRAPRARGGSAVKTRRAKAKGKSPRNKGTRKKTSQGAGAGGSYAAPASREPQQMSPPRGASAAQVLTKLGPAALPRKASAASPGGLFEPILRNRHMQQLQQEEQSYGHQALVPLRSHFSVNASGKSQGSGSVKGKKGQSGPGSKAQQQRGKPLKRKQHGTARSPVSGRSAASDGASLRSSRLFQDQLRSDAPVEVPWQ